jgi:hypothetical protein
MRKKGDKRPRSRAPQSRDGQISTVNKLTRFSEKIQRALNSKEPSAHPNMPNFKIRDSIQSFNSSHTQTSMDSIGSIAVDFSST